MIKRYDKLYFPADRVERVFFLIIFLDPRKRETLHESVSRTPRGLTDPDLDEGGQIVGKELDMFESPLLLLTLCREERSFFR